MNAEKKLMHEAFVSHLTGGSTLELLALLIIPVLFAVNRVFLEHLYPHKLTHIQRLVADSFFMIIAFLLPSTLLSDYVLEIIVIATTTTILLLSYYNESLSSLSAWDRPSSVFRRTVRAYTLVYSCVCIYAVDLSIFPRRLAKTELAGVSLMDTGVGLISITTGISNAAFISHKPSLTGRQVMRLIIPLVLLGLSRTLVVKTLGYQEHISEYGIHWNFFLTLAVLRFGGFIIGYLVGSRYSTFDAMLVTFMISAVCTGVHQVLILSPLGLNLATRMTPELLTDDVRLSSILLANAEGLISLPGYFALYLWGTALGLLVITHLPDDDAANLTKLKFLCTQEKDRWRGNPTKVSLAILCISLAFLMIVLASGEMSVSRRFVNFPYIALQIAITYGISSFLLLCIFRKPVATKSENPTPKDIFSLVTMISNNSMVYFLLSNIVTGLLNICIDTLELSKLEPTWLSNLYQFNLLVIYAIVCPIVADWLHLF